MKNITEVLEEFSVAYHQGMSYEEIVSFIRSAIEELLREMVVKKKTEASKEWESAEDNGEIFSYGTFYDKLAWNSARKTQLNKLKEILK